MPGELTTFCHITEYGEPGYEVLRGMIATSSTLTLWSPSSRLFRSPASSLSGAEFVELVRDGYVRVIGRAPWLLDRVFRDGHAWTAGAPWDEAVDGTLAAICREDENEPEDQRRVRVAPPEDGWSWAEQYLQARPDVVDEVFEVHLRNAPEGVLETAARAAQEDRQRSALSVLRDARNHGQAFHLSGARIPFFLSVERSPFIDLIEQSSPGGPTAPGVHGVVRDRTDEIAERLVHRVVELLRDLSAVRSPVSLTSFLRSGHHRDLNVWMSDLIDDLADTNMTEFDNLVLNRLTRQVSRQTFKPALATMFGQGINRLANMASFVMAMFAVAADPQNAMNLAGLATSGIPVTSGAAEAAGFISTEYHGTQWPYLYLFGRTASRRRHAELLQILEGLKRERDGATGGPSPLNR